MIIENIRILEIFYYLMKKLKYLIFNGLIYKLMVYKIKIFLKNHLKLKIILFMKNDLIIFLNVYKILYLN